MLRCIYNCDDPLSYNYSPRSSHIWFSYIHNFIIILSRFITHQLNDLLPVGLLVQLVARCTGIAEVKGLNPVQAWIYFSLSKFKNKLNVLTSIIVK